MRLITVAEAAQKLPDLIDAAIRGEEVVITKDGLSVVKLISASPIKRYPAKALIENEHNEKLFSIASAWAMAIKHSIGKLNFEIPFRDFLERQMLQNSMNFLNVQILHLDVVASLPLHHRDPFDRLIIAQVIGEQIPIVGTDEVFD